MFIHDLGNQFTSQFAWANASSQTSFWTFVVIIMTPAHFQCSRTILQAIPLLSRGRRRLDSDSVRLTIIVNVLLKVFSPIVRANDTNLCAFFCKMVYQSLQIPVNSCYYLYFQQDSMYFGYICSIIENVDINIDVYWQAALLLQGFGLLYFCVRFSFLPSHFQIGRIWPLEFISSDTGKQQYRKRFISSQSFRLLKAGNQVDERFWLCLVLSSTNEKLLLRDVIGGICCRFGSGLRLNK